MVIVVVVWFLIVFVVVCCCCLVCGLDGFMCCVIFWCRLLVKVLFVNFFVLWIISWLMFIIM